MSTLSGASAVRHPDEYAVRHLISATVYDWASQQTAQWRCRGQQTVQAALSNADWFRPGGGHRNEFSATRLDAAEQRAPLTADAQRPSSSTRGNAVASRRVGGSGATGATLSSSSQTPVQKVRRRFLFSPPASGKSGASGRSEGGTPTQRGAPRAVDARAGGAPAVAPNITRQRTMTDDAIRGMGNVVDALGLPRELP